LVELSARLDAAYAGNPAPNAADRAFAATVAAFNIPKTLPAALIEGLTWDAEGRRYESFEALLDYAARVAGAVGVMMALIMGVRGSAALARAADLGAAMQLTNIARDVGEDARAGRLFLPLDWLVEAGIEPDGFLADPQATPALRGLVRRLLAEAQTLYARAAAGIAMLPWECRTGIGAAHRIYAAIGGKIADAGYDSVGVRARVSGAEKMALAVRAAAGAVVVAPGKHVAALPANAFLVEAAAYDAPAEPGGVAKLLLLFERLERSQREAAEQITA
jgi:phytoene synthase